jgi:hypothetical protein
MEVFLLAIIGKVAAFSQRIQLSTHGRTRVDIQIPDSARRELKTFPLISVSPPASRAAEPRKV